MERARWVSKSSGRLLRRWVSFDDSIQSGADAAAKRAAGADLVQIYTGLIYRGPALVGECARALRGTVPALPRVADALS